MASYNPEEPTANQNIKEKEQKFYSYMSESHSDRLPIPSVEHMANLSSLFSEFGFSDENLEDPRTNEMFVRIFDVPSLAPSATMEPYKKEELERVLTYLLYKDIYSMFNISFLTNKIKELEGKLPPTEPKEE